MIPRHQTLLHIESELGGARAWAARHNVPLVWLPEQLELRVTFVQPETAEPFYLRGRVENYREVPPAWTFTDSQWTAEAQRQYFPRPAPVARGIASIFHPQPVICAPFNRLAYRYDNVAGPHSDWGGPANWLNAGASTQVRAEYIGDMLSVMHAHFAVTRGRMA